MFGGKEHNNDTSYIYTIIIMFFLGPADPRCHLGPLPFPPNGASYIGMNTTGSNMNACKGCRWLHAGRTSLQSIQSIPILSTHHI